MGLRMASPTKREGSENYWFRQRVPTDLRDRANGKLLLLSFPAAGADNEFVANVTATEQVKFSLRTRDPATAKARSGLAVAHLQKFFSSLRSGPSPISQRDMVALSGEIYRLFIDRFQENPGTPDMWAAFKAFNRAAREGRLSAVPVLNDRMLEESGYARVAFGDDLTAGVDSYPRAGEEGGLEARFGWLASWVLTKHGLSIDAGSRQKLLIEVERAATEAGWTLKRNAKGDYTPDPVASRFPAIRRRDGATIDSLFQKWKQERSPATSTVHTWDTVRRSLVEHLGHQNVERISDTDIVAWKDKLLAQGLAPKSINSTYLAAANVWFRFAVANRLLKSNPAEGIRLQVSKKAGESMQPYTDEEVGRLLAISKAKGGEERRWLIWLAATSGARIGEVAQLWGSRVRKEGDVHVMHFAPAEDGGSLKNEGSERVVPLHSILIKEGFLDFVRSKGSGPLFYKRSSGDASRRHATKGVTNHLAGWVRNQGFDNLRQAPNHALRHWWKSVAARAGIPDSIADALQGHAPQGAAGAYRHFSVRQLADAIERIPIPSIPRPLEERG